MLPSIYRLQIKLFSIDKFAGLCLRKALDKGPITCIPFLLHLIEVGPNLLNWYMDVAFIKITRWFTLDPLWDMLLVCISYEIHNPWLWEYTRTSLHKCILHRKPKRVNMVNVNVLHILCCVLCRTQLPINQVHHKRSFMFMYEYNVYSFKNALHQF